MNEQAPSSSRGFFDGNPKMLFVFGLVSGVAITLLFNQFSAGATTGSVLGSNKANDALNNGNTDTGTVTVKDIPDVKKDEHIKGDLNKAKVVIVEYSDFQCPFCERHHPTMQQIFDEYSNEVAWVYRHFPLTSIHPQALPSAVASECAAEQNKFWEYADGLFANQDLLADAYYPQLAGELGLDVNKFNTCLTSNAAKSAVTADQQGAIAAGVNGTPATYINGVLVADSNGRSLGAAPYNTIKALVDAELAE